MNAKDEVKRLRTTAKVIEGNIGLVDFAALHRGPFFIGYPAERLEDLLRYMHSRDIPMVLRAEGHNAVICVPGTGIEYWVSSSRVASLSEDVTAMLLATDFEKSEERVESA